VREPFGEPVGIALDAVQNGVVEAAGPWLRR